MAGKSNKKLLYVGGLSDEVDTKTINAMFVPFGEVVDVQLPLDFETQSHRGFAFVEFELAEDAAAAVDNMHESELYGRTLKVNYARPLTTAKGNANRAIWDDEDWLRENNDAVRGLNLGPNRFTDVVLDFTPMHMNVVSVFPCCLPSGVDTHDYPSTCIYLNCSRSTCML
eukprot:m.215535 g.215535  ORF g.215535 m.215535 type:complete len:170 (-) comp19101_c0_seq1:1143-1652(-)